MSCPISLTLKPRQVFQQQQPSRNSPTKKVHDTRIIFFNDSLKANNVNENESIKNCTAQAPEGDWCQTTSALCNAGLSSREPSDLIDSLAIR
jgi:hypothetical protein